MKKVRRVLLIILLLAVAATLWFVLYPTDIRNEYLLTQDMQQAEVDGKALLEKMENAHGGYDRWAAFESGSFDQQAVWYGRNAISHWDTLPQKFHMEVRLGTEEATLKLLNGPTTGNRYRIRDGKHLSAISGQDWQETEATQYHEKILFKGYWFQLPFRIREASIIRYAGQETFGGKTYDLLFASWGSESANADFDQYLLYLDTESHRIAWLYFTLRDKVKGLSMSSQFTNYQAVDSLILAHSQYVRSGRPEGDGYALHENHYENIVFGTTLTD